MARLVTLLLAVATALAAACVAQGAIAQGGSTPTEQGGSAPEWARVNLCAGNEVGVRAGIKGDRRGGRMRLRITLQWRNPETGAWAPVSGQASSKLLDSDSEDWTRWESGWTFRLEPPTAGSSYVLRGVAELKFLRRGRVLKSATATSGTCTIGEVKPPQPRTAAGRS
jgi:hypothetical protein